MDEQRARNEGTQTPRISRRRLLRWAPALAAMASFAGPRAALADAVPKDARTVPPSPLQSAPGDILALPFRTKTDAVKTATLRHYWEDRRNNVVSSPIERALGGVSLADSRLGLVNWPLVDETEDLNLGNFAFPINPFNTLADDGREQFVYFANTQVIANFRSREYLEQVHRRIFDRAVWAMDNGAIGTAIVEFDRPISDDKADQIVRLLGYYGVRTIIWGNELNDPHAPWRDNLPALFDALTAAAAAKARLKLPVELSLPGLAFYGQGEYLQKMLRTIKDLQRKKFPKSPDDLPIQRVADHYYGSVDYFPQRIGMMRGVMSAEGLQRLKYDLTEVGNPSVDPSLPRVTDDQMATGYIPQIASLAMGSGLVDRVCFFSALDGTDAFSFTWVQDSRLEPKPAYRSFVVMAKLFSRLHDASIADANGVIRVTGKRTDGMDFQVAWSKAEGNDLWMDLPHGWRVFDPLGQEGKEDRAGQIVLKPKQHVSLGGPARILIGPKR